MKKKSIKSTLFVIIAIFVAYTIFHFIGIGCPIRFITGIPCAGCGMSRAWLYALQFDFQAAFYYHPLWPLAPIILALIIFHEKIYKKFFIISLTIIALFFIIIYIIRLFSPNDTVIVIDITQSIVIKLIKMLRRILEL